MTEEQVREAILRHLARIAPEADLSSLNPEQPLQRALDIDSYDFLNLLVAVRGERSRLRNRTTAKWERFGGWCDS